MLGEYHGNTTLANFYIYDDYKCVLLNNTSKESRKLTKPKQYNDYNIFFTSCSKELMHNNIYFIGILNRHKMSVFEALVLFQDKK
jgi:hypothetical protein